MKASLLKALRKATEVSLKIDSELIVLIPHVKTKQPGGGYALVAGTPRAPQQFSVEATVAALSGISGTAGGVTKGEGTEVHTWAYQLVGRYNSEIAIGDTWAYHGTIYRVVGLQPYNGYERRAVVSAIGADPNYGN